MWTRKDPRRYSTALCTKCVTTDLAKCTPREASIIIIVTVIIFILMWVFVYSSCFMGKKILYWKKDENDSIEN